MADSSQRDSGAGPTPTPDEEEQRRQRIEALGALAGASAPGPSGEPRTIPPAAASSPHPRQGGAPRRVWWVVGLAVVLCLAILAGLSLRPRLSSSRTPPTRPNAEPITPAADGITCPADAAFSPDGTRLAVVGYQHACPHDANGDGYEPGMLIIYNVSAPHPFSRVRPDASIAASLGIDLTARVTSIQSPIAGPGATPTITVMYQTVLWSPDGTRLALPFFAQALYYNLGVRTAGTFLSPRLPGVGPITAGVVITDVNGQDIHVMSATFDEGQPTVEWDLTAGKRIVPQATIAPALAYQWTADGALVPQTPLSADVLPPPPPLGPVGNPDGGPSFTVWQSGEGGPVAEFVNNEPVVVRNLSFWSAPLNAWSPDARYLVQLGLRPERVEWPGLAAPDVAPPFTLADVVPHYDIAPLLPLRDAAIGASYKQPRGVPVPNAVPEPARVGWRPDGRVLALFDGTQVSVEDCQTGRVLKVLKPTPALSVQDTLEADSLLPGLQPNFTGVLRWSANGARLLLLDEQLGTVTIWSGSELPS